MGCKALQDERYLKGKIFCFIGQSSSCINKILVRNVYTYKIYHGEIDSKLRFIVQENEEKSVMLSIQIHIRALFLNQTTAQKYTFLNQKFPSQKFESQHHHLYYYYCCCCCEKLQSFWPISCSSSTISGSLTERESLALFNRKTLVHHCSLIQGNKIEVLSMDYCCTLSLPTLLLYNRLLVQYFEKEIYVEMCVFRCKPFFVKPQVFFFCI